MDVSDGSEAPAWGDERVVGLHPRQLADATHWHGQGGGGLGHAAAVSAVVAQLGAGVAHAAAPERILKSFGANHFVKYCICHSAIRISFSIQ